MKLYHKNKFSKNIDMDGLDILCYNQYEIILN